ncbi:MAG: fused MFS/spermidine synthase [Verrucomicrobia bacterium]|nr:fused MFS/spermidine synthase [Verrucomicrobiota bacterium]
MKKKPAPLPEQAVSPALRRYLYFSAACTGAAIMIIEILGAKMLAPFFGTSHFVWTAQIAVTLLALATGYYAGGRLVDRNPRLGRIYACVLIAAIYLGLTIVVVEPVSFWCLKFKLALGSLIAALFLFFVPLALLAMVGPFLVRVLTVSVENVGGIIGRLTAISTLGSVAGTVLIGYILVPFFPNSMTMYFTAGLLMAIVAAYFFLWATSKGSAPAAAVGIAAGLVLGYGGTTKERLVHTASIDEIYRANSNFGLLQVTEDKETKRRDYYNDYLVQNIYDPIQKKSLALFTYALHQLSHAYTPRIQRALCIGLGVGIVPMQFAREGVKVDVVEINPGVVTVATNHFDCEIEKLNLFIGDGRHFVNETQEKYDTIILDAFLGDSSPSHLMTTNAFGAMRRILKENGTLVINSFGSFEAGRDYFTASLEKTLRWVFASVRAHSEGSGGTVNVFFVASDQPDLRPLKEPDFGTVHPFVRHRARNAYATARASDPTHGIVLTDDYNPIEFYDAATREEHRRSLALYMPLHSRSR